MNGPFLGTEPILCAHLLRHVDNDLVHLLRSLPPPEWDLPSVAGTWKVRDIAAHLLDTPLRKLSLLRDGCVVEAVEIRSAQDLAALVNRLNQEGVQVYRRLSPRVLTDWMEQACQQSADFHEALDPFAPAAFAVSWAGEHQSLNWFDTARELTERWHHQQQIRLATNRPGSMTREIYHPVLDCFLRGLPHCFRDVAATEGTGLLVEIAGDCGGQWLLLRSSGGWTFSKYASSDVEAHVMIPQHLAWRLFTKGISREEAHANLTFIGNQKLAEHVLQLTAIVA